MAELLQDAAAALLPPPPAGVALTLLLLELSLAQPASPVLAASTAIAAIAATVICLIPASSSLPARSRELLSRTGGRVLPRPSLPRRGEGRLKDVPFSAVYHGPLPRAAQTAKLIAAKDRG
jgi:hypothetical protein